MADPKSNVYTEWIEAFTIFAKYEQAYGNIAAEHDVVYAGPDPDHVTFADIDRLEVLGWHVSTEYDCFYSFV